MQRKFLVNELLYLACVYAESDRQSFLYSIENTGDQELIAETKAFLEQLRTYRLKRWGKTKMEAYTENAESVDVGKILLEQRMKLSNGNKE